MYLFYLTRPGRRKIVIATNIAESSITIDDIVFVVDGGKHKEKTYDAENDIACLLPAWVSAASAHQRRGRAGRVQAGRAWHLFPRRKLAELDKYQQPEIVRTPLTQLCLQVRQLGLAAPGVGGIAGFLQRAVTPATGRDVYFPAGRSTVHRYPLVKKERPASERRCGPWAGHAAPPAGDRERALAPRPDRRAHRGGGGRLRGGHSVVIPPRFSLIRRINALVAETHSGEE
jgi:hypothetical protein